MGVYVCNFFTPKKTGLSEIWTRDTMSYDISLFQKKNVSLEYPGASEKRS